MITRTIQGGPGSVRLRFGDGTVRANPVFGSGGSSKEGFLCVSVQFHREDGSGFGSWKTVPAVPILRSVPANLNGSDGSGFRFRFGSWTTLTILLLGNSFPNHTVHLLHGACWHELCCAIWAPP